MGCQRVTCTSCGRTVKQCEVNALGECPKCANKK